MKQLPETPTLNREYNYILVRWAEQGYPSNPECEECGCDLTGKKVRDTPTMWLCTDCADKDEFVPNEDFREDERKQMGITG